MPTQALSVASSLQQQLDACPFHQLFGFKVRSIDPQRASICLQLPFQDTFERAVGSGQYHGGVIATLIDVAGDFALLQTLGHGVPTINFRIDYLKPAMQGELSATATARRVGKTIGVVDVDVADAAGALVAIGRACYATRHA